MLDCEVTAKVRAVAVLYHANMASFDRGAWEVMQFEEDEAVQMLADLVGKSKDWVWRHAKAHELRLELEVQKDEIKAELHVDPVALMQLTNETIMADVASKFTAKDPTLQLNLADCVEYLRKYSEPGWTVEKVRADLPHHAKEQDYGVLVARLEKMLNLFIKPVLLNVPPAKQKVAMEIAALMKQLSGLVNKYMQMEG